MVKTLGISPSSRPREPMKQGIDGYDGDESGGYERASIADLRERVEDLEARVEELEDLCQMAARRLREERQQREEERTNADVNRGP